jgi:hypothetical protein
VLLGPGTEIVEPTGGERRLSAVLFDGLFDQKGLAA